MTIDQIIRAAVDSSMSQRLRHPLQQSEAPEVTLRRAVIGVSVVGIAVLAAATLYRSGAVKHRPGGFKRDLEFRRAGASTYSFNHKAPDSPLSLFSHAINIVLAAAGGKRRARNAPWLAISASLAAIPAALTAAQYLFYQLPVKGRRWSASSAVDALSHIATLGFTVYESARALSHVKRTSGRGNLIARVLH